MPGFNVDLFRSNVGKNGFVQSNKYEVIIRPNVNFDYIFTSNEAQATTTDIVKDLQYRCIDAALPGVALRTMDTNRYGPGILEKMPFTANYTDTSLTFICDKNGSTYNFWYGWLNYIFIGNGKDSDRPAISTTSNRPYYTAAYKDDYAAQIDIIVYENSGKPSLSYTLYKAYPLSINDAPLSWANNNNLLKLTVNMTFREWAQKSANIEKPTFNVSTNLAGNNVNIP